MSNIDYARSLLLDPKKLVEERSRIQSLKESVFGPDVKVREDEGISVVVPTYQGARRVARLLDSLQNQSIAKDLFEVVLVANGAKDDTLDIANDYARTRTDLNLRTFYRKPASAGAARNLGLKLASRRYVTFVDDDDTVQPDYLKTAYKEASDDRIVLSPIVNTFDGLEVDAETSLNLRILNRMGEVFPVVEAPWALGFNACKLFPKKLALRVAYREDLKSGEDLVYFANMLAIRGLEFVVPKTVENAAYVRWLRDNSVSRRDLSRQFAVSERLDCMAALRELSLKLDTKEDLARNQLFVAQAGFVERYLLDNPDDFDSVSDEVAQKGLYQFPWGRVNKGKAKDLAFVYCFSPYSDTSAVVAAKVLASRGKIVDVISNNMDKVRRKEPTVNALVSRYIDNHRIIDAPPSFAGWNAISTFATKAVFEAERIGAQKGGYDSVYSRALWVGSHVAAALYKMRHFRTRWSAEFSDPLRRDAAGTVRPGPYEADDISQKLINALKARGFEHIENSTLFDLVELVTLVYADELIFTNQNQMEYMLSLYDDNRIKQLAMSKSTIRHHPVPPKSAYDVVTSTYPVPEDVVNIGYFGSFYPSRGIGEVLTAIENLNFSLRRWIRLHVFCNVVADVKTIVFERQLQSNVIVNPYLSYMEFLNVTTRFDVLMVNDVLRSGDLHINPFLPSKYSDYLGSGTKIWAIVDEGSPLSRVEVDYKSEAGNSADILNTLASIARQGSVAH
ncbi:glycosyltransferase [Actinomyces trachealis]|uniref:glycosyltransferase n=1 Tax=Actinomyces trachealis TaxID=2763540 RepID=UPI0018C7628E|nr:glycosyltransferase [Actinomyces trachealis]